ncbi:MAG: hypothetical protein R3C19_18550 [Planctomycetaceae bacterium]
MPRSSVLSSAGCAVLWIAAAWGILKSEPLVAAVVGSNHAICGSWGCGPPTSSLIVWNTFVAMSLFTIVWLAQARRPATTRRWSAAVAWIIAASVVAAIGIHTAMWWSSASEFGRSFLWQRVLFAMVAFPDLPAIPLVSAAGFLCWLTRFRRIPRQHGDSPHGVTAASPHTAAEHTHGSLADQHLRPDSQQIEDFGNVAVRKVNAPS